MEGIRPFLAGTCIVRVLLLVAFSAQAQGVEAQSELFLLAAKTSLLSDLVHKPISETTPVSDTVQGTLMRGSALTQGIVTVAPFPSRDGIGLTMVLNSTTDAYTLNTNSPRPDIGIEFDWTIFTRAVTQKPILLKETGFSLYGASSSAQSEITIHGLGTSAEGLFWRLKNRIAQKKAWETLIATKTKNEAQAAEKIAGQLTTMVDKQVYDALLPIQQKYYTYVYNPFIRDGLLGGHLAMGSDASWIAFRGMRGNDRAPLDVSLIPGLEEAGRHAPVVVRLHQDLLERLASQRIAGTEITEVEIGEMLGRVAPLRESRAEIKDQEKNELLFHFDDEYPLQIQFADSRIRIVFRLSELTTQGQHLKNLKIARVLVISRPAADRILLSRAGPVLVTGYDDRPLEASISRYIQDRMEKTLAKEPLELTLKTLFKNVKPMRLRTLEAERGTITLGLAPTDK